MPILLMILSALGGVLWWWVRNNPRAAFYTASDAVMTLRNAPRRLAFRKQMNAHPVEGIDDPRIAICGLAQAFIELDDLPTKEQRQQLHVLLRTKLRCDAEEAEEMEVLGRWLMAQCNGAKPAITRLSRRLYKIDGTSSWNTLQEVFSVLVTDNISQGQAEAIADIRLAFKLPRNA